jgi:hypothetical protein
MSRYKIIIADNFHYMDEDAYSEAGAYDTLPEATEVCRAIVERSLAAVREPGMNAEQLYQQYTSFGDDPFIVALGDAPLDERFSAWTYAKARCRDICGG